jgi:16S rRNA (cytosine967-C5)-methyltransferase
MSRYHSYLSSAVAIIENYKGAEPFVHFIKKQFALNKKFGSRDRKTISSICYAYFRAVHVLKKEEVSVKIISAVFLCEHQASLLLAELNPDFNEKIAWPVAEKLNYLGIKSASIFPFAAALSSEIDNDKFALSFLRQPLLYLRLRPDRQKIAISKLREAGLYFELIGDDCIVLQNATSLDAILRINRDAVVQDYNSQRVFDSLENLSSFLSKEKKVTVWDCCAASGGKSILLYDRMQGNLKLTVSDIRKSILYNLQQRLQQAGVPVYHTFAADLQQQHKDESLEPFDVIICDVPCTGSGTWSRTPEQLVFFTKEVIGDYAQRQTAIVGNAARYLKAGGILFYITCSVFKGENEDIVEMVQKNYSLTLLQQHYLKGYEMQADTLFVAVLTK